MRSIAPVFHAFFSASLMTASVAVFLVVMVRVLIIIMSSARFIFDYFTIVCNPLPRRVLRVQKTAKPP